MNKSRFLEFVDNYILKMFTGSEIIGEELSSPRDNCVAQGDAGSIKIKFSRSDPYRIIVKRAQPFKNFEIHLVKSIIEEMGKVISIKTREDYIKGLENLIIEKAICKSLTNSTSNTLGLLLNMLAYWGQRTYEGKHMSLGFVVTKKKMGAKTNPTLHISKFLKKDFSVLLTDGESSFMEISGDGYISDYVYYSKIVDDRLYAPYKHLKLATLSSGAKVGVCLTEEGDILIFKEKSLLFAKRAGAWVCYSHEEIVGKLSEHAGEYEDVRSAIYLSALDTSFNRTGGCIVHVNSTESKNVLKHIDESDVHQKDAYDFIQQYKIDQSFFANLDENTREIPSFEKFLMEDKNSKTATLIKLIAGRKFQDLDRKFRQELLAIDGATVIDYDGTVLAVGAIIKIEAGSSGGGRLAAAKTLSNYGISIKISNDGSMQGFKMDKNKLRVRTLFVL